LADFGISAPEGSTYAALSGGVYAATVLELSIGSMLAFGILIVGFHDRKFGARSDEYRHLATTIQIRVPPAQPTRSPLANCSLRQWHPARIAREQRPEPARQGCSRFL
jgi:hypothetical protein